MLITGTSDKIQVVLGASVSSTQLPFTANYNNYTSTAVALTTNNGTTNNTTAVDLVPSPSSSQQNELRYCSIINSDTANATVRIQVFDGSNTRIVFQAILAPSETLQYQLEKGWEVIDAQGNKETFMWSSFTNSISGHWLWRNASVATSVGLTQNIVYLFTLCKADKSLTSFNIMYNVTSVFTASPTWGEMAIYSGQRIAGDADNPLIRRGFTDISGVWTSTGIKKTTITTSGITAGDQVVLAFGWSGSAAGNFRTAGVAAIDIGDASASQTITNANNRPSTNTFLTYATTNTTPFAISWQAT